MDADVALLQEASPPPDDVVQLRDARSVGLPLVELRLVARALERTV